MSNADFELPKTVNVPPPAARDYAPKRALAAIADAISNDPPPYTAPNGKPYTAPRHQDAIRESLKKLTHREMRELVAEIYKAHQKIERTDGGSGAIALSAMPDVLDAFAYGDTPEEKTK
jgi:hypothetical protein